MKAVKNRPAETSNRVVNHPASHQRLDGDGVSLGSPVAGKNSKRSDSVQFCSISLRSLLHTAFVPSTFRFPLGVFHIPIPGARPKSAAKHDKKRHMPGKPLVILMT